MALTKADCTLCLVRVGGVQLLFDPSDVMIIEGRFEPAPESPFPEVDLRLGLRVSALDSTRSESLVVHADSGPLRLIVCAIEQILRSDLRALEALPYVLQGYGRKLGLRGVVSLKDGLAYLAAPADLGAALLRGQAA